MRPRQVPRCGVVAGPAYADNTQIVVMYLDHILPGRDLVPQRQKGDPQRAESVVRRNDFRLRRAFAHTPLPFGGGSDGEVGVGAFYAEVSARRAPLCSDAASEVRICIKVWAHARYVIPHPSDQPKIWCALQIAHQPV